MAGTGHADKSFDLSSIALTWQDQVTTVGFDSAFLTIQRDDVIKWQVEVFSSDEVPLDLGSYQVEMTAIGGRTFRGRARLSMLLPVGGRGTVAYFEGSGRLDGFDVKELR
jgi:hypothetical protein